MGKMCYIAINDKEYEIPLSVFTNEDTDKENLNKYLNKDNCFDLLELFTDNNLDNYSKNKKIEYFLKSCFGATEIVALESDNDSMANINKMRGNITKYYSKISRLLHDENYDDAYNEALLYLELVLEMYNRIVAMDDNRISVK